VGSEEGEPRGAEQLRTRVGEGEKFERQVSVLDGNPCLSSFTSQKQGVCLMIRSRMKASLKLIDGEPGRKERKERRPAWRHSLFPKWGHRLR